MKQIKLSPEAVQCAIECVNYHLQCKTVELDGLESIRKDPAQQELAKDMNWDFEQTTKEFNLLKETLKGLRRAKDC